MHTDTQTSVNTIIMTSVGHFSCSWITQASASRLPPPQELKPHEIVQHHCTSSALSLHPAIPLCWELLTHGWLNQQFWVRGIHLHCGRRCALLVIYLSAGTSPRSYSQHTWTLVITSWAAFCLVFTGKQALWHRRTVGGAKLCRKVNEQLVNVPE